MSTTFSITPTADRPWVHEMVIVHRAFRREFTLLPRLVREVADGDVERARVVAAALRVVVGGLGMHHTGEDVVLWPRLLERAAPSTGLVETMQAQHHRVDECTEQLRALLAAWETAPTSARGRELADLLDVFAATLLEHLDLEEREILPLCLQHITPAEWDGMKDHGVELMDRSQLPIIYGAVLEECDAVERRAMLSRVPFPARVLLSSVGAWQYRRYVRRVRGR